MRGTPLAEACAARVRADVAAAPGSRWNRTGKLLGSVAADGTAVVVTADRLQRDETAQLFADECVKDPTDDAAFVKALDDRITEALGDE
jgi:hypothetical protein